MTTDAVAVSARIHQLRRQSSATVRQRRTGSDRPVFLSRIRMQFSCSWPAKGRISRAIPRAKAKRASVSTSPDADGKQKSRMFERYAQTSMVEPHLGSVLREERRTSAVKAG